jgi:hypothetical protein
VTSSGCLVYVHCTPNSKMDLKKDVVLVENVQFCATPSEGSIDQICRSVDPVILLIKTALMVKTKDE